MYFADELDPKVLRLLVILGRTRERHLYSYLNSVTQYLNPHPDDNLLKKEMEEINELCNYIEENCIGTDKAIP